MSSHETPAVAFAVDPPHPPNEGHSFVNHAPAGRSGHLGHALVQYAPGKLLAFYPNCSDFNRGHSGDGWMEYKRSEDGGRTWSAPMTLAYSRQVYDQGVDHSIMCEKAVRTDDGDILLFNLECRGKKWAPLAAPTYLRSTSGGLDWEEPRPMGDQPGRIFDAIIHDSTIYVLEFCNDSTLQWYGSLPEHHFSLYVSTDQGQSFHRRSVVPFSYDGRGYGTLAFLRDGRLIAYTYNIADEKQLDYVISQDSGHSWSSVQTAYMAKQIRNPQMTAFKDGFVMHGRSGSKGDDAIKGHFVLYTSQDGIHWDAGQYLRKQDAGSGAYSNNVCIDDPQTGAKSLLIQASHAYDEAKTNICHWYLT